MVKIPKLQDQFLLAYILGETVQKVCGVPLVTQQNTELMQDYPFFTYNFVTLEEDETADWVGTKGRTYTCLVQIDCHSNEPYGDKGANDLARRLYEALHEAPYRRFFTQADIVPQTFTQTSNRTTAWGVNYDYDFGFDCSFFVRGGVVYDQSQLNFEYSSTTIDSVKTADTVTSSAVNVERKEGEK